MTELLETAASWETLFVAILVFGLAPGPCLRLIVLAYPRDHPRPAELIAELYEIPLAQRPFWVAQQLELAFFEGLPLRLSAARNRRRAKVGCAEEPTQDREEPIGLYIL